VGGSGCGDIGSDCVVPLDRLSKGLSNGAKISEFGVILTDLCLAQDWRWLGGSQLNFFFFIFFFHILI
jgi:hypothetical protein